MILALCFLCPTSSVALRHGDFVPCDCLAAKDQIPSSYAYTRQLGRKFLAVYLKSSKAIFHSPLQLKNLQSCKTEKLFWSCCTPRIQSMYYMPVFSLVTGGERGSTVFVKPGAEFHESCLGSTESVCGVAGTERSSISGVFLLPNLVNEFSFIQIILC